MLYYMYRAPFVQIIERTLVHSYFHRYLKIYPQCCMSAEFREAFLHIIRTIICNTQLAKHSVLNGTCTCWRSPPRKSRTALPLLKTLKVGLW